MPPTSEASTRRSNHGEFKAKHGASCACCGGKLLARKMLGGKNVAKSFPASRPWMISH